MQPQDVRTVIAPATPQHPRQTEASIAALEDGRLLLAWTDFYDADWRDWGPARIMARWSNDQGESWSDAFVLQENIGRINVMEASLIALRSGRILLAFMRKDNQGCGDCRDGILHVMAKRSDDAGVTWTSPQDVTSGDAYWCATNDRLLQLQSGRLLLPVGEHTAGCHVWVSDDAGETWRKGRGAVKPPQGVRYAEPTAVETADGRVLMFIRADGNRLRIAESSDEGEFWSVRDEPGPPSPFAPCMVRRLPQSRDLLLIWNNHNVRSNLTAAVSSDSARTWRRFSLLEPQAEWPLAHTYAYPSLVICGSFAHMTYWRTDVVESDARRFHLIYRRVPLSVWTSSGAQCKGGLASL